MDWAKILLALLNWLGSLTTWARESSLLEKGSESHKAKDLQVETEVLKKAIEAREEARIANASVPESASLPDDGFRRD